MTPRPGPKRSRLDLWEVGSHLLLAAAVLTAVVVYVWTEATR